MPKLELRQEFLTPHMRGTAIELRNKQNSGWVQRSAADLLRITYPTVDVQRALDAISANGAGKPVVFMGQRGRGKSHNLAVLYHAFAAPDVVEGWAKEWGTKLGSARLTGLKLQRGLLPIAETLSDQEFPTLWDVLFSRHPEGPYFRGQFDKAGSDVPSKPLVQEMLAKKPVALILDEFQTWYDGTRDLPGDDQPKRRQWAFNFIQILSEIADDRPDLLALVVSVRNSGTDGYRQIHRIGELLVDFKSQAAQDDRKRLVLHRLFNNRDNIPRFDIEQAVAPYASERIRLLYPDKPDAEKAALVGEVADAWPFSPELLDLLDDHILKAGAAQETRDLIRVLAEVSRARLGKVPVITPSDFLIDDDSCGVTTLIDSFNSADQEHLREKALQNLKEIQNAGVKIPYVKEVITGIWMRSLDPTDAEGASRQELQLDLTRDAKLNDNTFTAQLGEIYDSSSNIHELGTADKRLCFKLPENPVTKLKASAKNDNLFEPDTASPPNLIPVGKDQTFLREVLTHLLRSPEAATEIRSRPVVLDPNWQKAPWANVPQNDQPEKWERPVLIVLPVAPADLNGTLGPWLKDNVLTHRNMVRFLLPKNGLPSVYEDRDLILTARQVFLAKDWKERDSQYADLYRRYDKDLRKDLAERFDRYALLERWDYQAPASCTFRTGNHDKAGSEVPNAVEARIKEDCFAPEDFELFVLDAAKPGKQYTMKQVIDTLRNEPLPGQVAIPYLGDNAIFDQVVRIAAKGKIALNVDGKWCVAEPGQTEKEAFAAIHRNAWSPGRALHTIQICEPSQVGSQGMAAVAVPQPGPFPGVTPPAGIVPPGVVPPFVTPPGTPTPQPGVPPLVPPAEKVPIIRKSVGAKNGTNLLADLEKWAYADKTKVLQANLTFHGITIKDLRDLCTRLPAKLLAELQIMLPPDDEKPA